MNRAKFPNDPAEMADFRYACLKYILPGYAPETPLFDRQARAITAGSCFAEHIAKSFQRLKIHTDHLQYGEGHNSPPSTLAVLDEIFSGEGQLKWEGKFRDASLFVLTIGMAITALLDGKPTLKTDRETIRGLTFHLLAPQEIQSYVVKIIERVRSVSPDIIIILTESPLPLNSAIGHASVFGQDCLSKSSVRFGLELVIQRGIPGVYYWPSFEMVRWLAPHRGQAFGVDGADNRHISQGMTDDITGLFIETYFKP